MKIDGFHILNVEIHELKKKSPAIHRESQPKISTIEVNQESQLKLINQKSQPSSEDEDIFFHQRTRRHFC